MIRVVKVGGSLFDLVDLPGRLRDWLSRQPPAHSVLIAGGGAAVDDVRRRQEIQPLDEAAAHWLCVDLMSETAQALHRQLSEFPLTADFRRANARRSEVGATIFDASAWLRQVEPGLPGVRLSWTWETSSDSIAGRLAVALGCDELVLLKSALPSRSALGDPGQLAAAGYVDVLFPRLAGELPPTRMANLRDSDYPEARLAGFRPFASA
jgi:aspartokinase-like uncharacterized kinase